jgi:hypothetical protein
VRICSESRRPGSVSPLLAAENIGFSCRSRRRGRPIPPAAGAALGRLAELGLLRDRHRPGWSSREITLLQPPEGFPGWFVASEDGDATPAAAAAGPEETRQGNSLANVRDACRDDLEPLGVPEELIEEIVQDSWALLDLSPSFHYGVFEEKLAKAQARALGDEDVGQALAVGDGEGVSDRREVAEAIHTRPSSPR